MVRGKQPKRKREAKPINPLDFVEGTPDIDGDEAEEIETAPPEEKAYDPEEFDESDEEEQVILSDDSDDLEEEEEDYPDDTLSSIDHELLRKIAEQKIKEHEDEYDCECPECGGPVACDATRCPHCGMLFQDIVSDEEEEDQYEPEEEIDYDEEKPESPLEGGGFDLNSILQQLMGGGAMGGGEDDTVQTVRSQLTQTEHRLEELQKQVKQVIQLLTKEEEHIIEEEKKLERKMAIYYYKGVIMSLGILIAVAIINAYAMTLLQPLHAYFLLLMSFGIWLLITLHLYNETPAFLESIHEDIEDHEESISLISGKKPAGSED